MTKARLLGSAVFLGSAAACTLTTSLDGYAGADARDGGNPTLDGGEGGALDASPDAPPTDAPAGYREAVMSDGPLAYWRLGETSGLIAHDETGRFNGTYSGACTFAAPGALAGDQNGALRLNARTCTVTLGDTLAFPGNAPFTIEAWVAVDNVVDTQHVFTKQTRTATGPVDGYALVIVNGKLYVERAVNGADPASDSVPMPTKSFVHAVGVYDGAALHLYVDGALIGGPLGTTATDAMKAFNAPAAIGSTGGGEGFVTGVLDEVAIYDKALPAARIKAHYDLAVGAH